MTLDKPVNNNYAAVIVRVPGTVPLAGLDNLVGVNIFGSQILTQKSDVAEGDLRVYFPAEVQLSEEYARMNNLHRSPDLNFDPEEVGYLEANRRVKAIKFRGHRSDALLMPLSSLASFAGYLGHDFQEGDTFDHLGGEEVCRKYVNPNTIARETKVGDKKLKDAFKRVTTKVFPEHLSTDNFWRNQHLIDENRECVVTQKLHGTSIRVGRVPVRRSKGFLERVLNRFVDTPDYEYDAVFGSRKVIKDANNPNQQHYYKSDIWTEFGRSIEAKIPEGYIVYGELIGWTPDGAPIQKDYTYDLAAGEAELYVYRVAVVNAAGDLADLPWDGVRKFCAERGLKHVPEFFRHHQAELRRAGSDITLLEQVDSLMDIAYAKVFTETHDPMVPLSNKKTVDEGVCIRQDAINPTILKAKSPVFLQHETKMLDADEADLEAAA